MSIKHINIGWGGYLIGAAVAGLIFPDFFYSAVQLKGALVLPKEMWPLYVLVLSLMAILGLTYWLNASNLEFTKNSVVFRFIAALILTLSAISTGYYGVIFLGVVDVVYALFVNKCLKKQ